MANKVKKISINALEKAVGEQHQQEKILEWNGISIVVSPVLTLKGLVSFTKSVVENCFAKDGMEYIPEIKDFAIRSALIEHYTNISLPQNVEKRYDLLYCSDLVDRIVDVVDCVQFNAMIDAINKKVAHLARANIEAISVQTNEILRSLETLYQQFSGIFAGIDDGDLARAMSVFAGGVDESKLVGAVIDRQNQEDNNNVSD